MSRAAPCAGGRGCAASERPRRQTAGWARRASRSLGRGCAAYRPRSSSARTRGTCVGVVDGIRGDAGGGGGGGRRWRRKTEEVAEESTCPASRHMSAPSGVRPARCCGCSGSARVAPPRPGAPAPRPPTTAGPAGASCRALGSRCSCAPQASRRCRRPAWMTWCGVRQDYRQGHRSQRASSPDRPCGCSEKRAEDVSGHRREVQVGI